MVKDQQFLKLKASYCLDLAKKMGATDASVTVGHSISETVNFRNKSLEASDRSDGLALSIETYLGKRRSSISSSNLLDENIKTLIEKCFETTKITPEDEFNSLPDKNLLAKQISSLNLYDETRFENDKKIKYLKDLDYNKNSFIFHAGTKFAGGELVSNGGRVLNVTSTGKVFKNIRNNIIKNIRKINWKEGFFRKDIGWRVIKKQ